MKRGFALVVLLVMGSLTMYVAMGIQGPPAGGQGGRGAGAGGQGGRGGPAQLQTIKVKDNLYMITGGGGNTGVFITSAGVVLVDTKLANNGQGILDQVKMVTDKPVSMVINTHTHGDHNGSNEFFTGKVEFVAHENTKANMQKMPAFEGDKAKFIPSRVYKDSLTIGSGADQIVLYYFGPAHTNGDSFVVFPAVRTVHTGDAFASKGLPLVDTNNGGSAVEYGKTLAKAASTIRNVDTIINGHITDGPSRFEDLKTYADFNNEVLAWVQQQIKAGKTAEDAAKEFQIPAKYTGYAIGGRGATGYVNAAYAELTKK